MREFLFEIHNQHKEDLENKIIVGLDEAGRGPLAGPVYAAACILDENFPIEILNDSKKLNKKKLLEAYNTIITHCTYFSVAWCSVEEIDELNILWASMRAMEKAYKIISEKYNKHIDIALVDGNTKPNLDVETKAIVKGDAIYPEIMAASILAKVSRDKFMCECDKKWPQYGFKKHMGYPTKQHRLMVEKHGLSPIHRKSFTFKKVESDQLNLF